MTDSGKPLRPNSHYDPVLLIRRKANYERCIQQFYDNCWIHILDSAGLPDTKHTDSEKHELLQELCPAIAQVAIEMGWDSDKPRSQRLGIIIALARKQRQPSWLIMELRTLVDELKIVGQ